MTYDRTEFDAAREAGLQLQHSRRLAHSLAARIRASRYTAADANGNLTIQADELTPLAAEILNLGDLTDTPRSDS